MKKHNLRFGGDVRRNSFDLRSNTNPRGTFLFTGFATAAGPGTSTGYDLADFLLGVPQQTSIQFGSGDYHFRGDSFSLFVQDDWRLHPRLTINAGLRYEYVSPYTEADGRLANLDVAPGFTAVAEVLPGESGPFTGPFPESLVNPDRNNFAPRIGIAWKVAGKTVLRAGYGVNYSTAAYSGFVQQLAFQPPFSFTETNLFSPQSPLSLTNGFPAPTAAVTNNFGVDRDYRLGYVQTWNLNIQQELTRGLILNVDYTGNKGTRLDSERAPNRGPTGLRIPDVQPFLWQSSEAASVYHSGSIRVRKRMANGFAAGGTYTYSKSIDNASTIGGGAIVVAQNDLDLAAERGLSSFDQRHRFIADYVYELPFGSGKHWLAGEGWGNRLLGDWTVNGSISIGSGTPFTARVLGDFTDIARGTTGTLRANYNGAPIQLSDPTIEQFFNTGAFSIPAPGTFGDAGRNTIIGPGYLRFDMSIGKSIQLKDMRAFEFRAQASNIFNHPQFSAIDTVVNSPTFGQVVSVGSMRKISFNTRFRF
jgi:outer membrane receptor protein involved in Fe transport